MNRTEEMPFTPESCTMSARDQREYMLPLHRDSDCCFCGAAADMHAALAFRSRGKMQGLLLRAEFLDEQTFARTKSVGLKLKLCEESPYLAIYQHKEWWIRPAFGEHFSEVPSRTQFILTKNKEAYGCFLAVSDNCRADLQGCADGLLLSLSPGCDGLRKIEDCALVYASGEDPYALAEEAFSFALSLTDRRMPLRRQKAFPELFEGLGWCSWDSLGREVSEQAIIDKMEEYKKLGVPIQWVLIDDGWSESDREKLTLRGLDADPARFPHGLKGTVRVLKEKYGIRHVGVWQAMQGYWNGIEPGSEAERRLKPFLQVYPNGCCSVRADASAAFGFWDCWHTFLEKAGVDFIKVDNQGSFTQTLDGVCSFREGYSALYEGLEASASQHFDRQMINCMGMPPENIWNRKCSALSRNSDDYLPRQENSFTEHALQNCYNSIYHGCLYWEDWDMVWSTVPNAEQGILLRIMSGGPFYLSEGLHQTDPALIGRAVFPDGTITRCQDVAKPTLDCLFDPGILLQKSLKIFNHYEEVIYTAVFLAAEAERERRETIRREDFPNELPASYWVYDWKKRTAQLCREKDVFSLGINSGEAGLYHILPAKGGAAVIGIAEKYISRACVDWIFEDRETTLVRLNCAGTFAFLTEKPVKEVSLGRDSADFHQDGSLVLLPVSKAPATVKIRLEASDECHND